MHVLVTFTEDVTKLGERIDAESLEEEVRCVQSSCHVWDKISWSAASWRARMAEGRDEFLEKIGQKTQISSTPYQNFKKLFGFPLKKMKWAQKLKSSEEFVITTSLSPSP